VVKHAKAATRVAVASHPGGDRIEAITLERGVTHDTEFDVSGEHVWNFDSGWARKFRSTDSAKHHHRCLQRGRAARDQLQGFSLWVSEFQALSDLDANANAVAIQHIKLENEGWSATTTLGTEEPSFD